MLKTTVITLPEELIKTSDKLLVKSKKANLVDRLKKHFGFGLLPFFHVLHKDTVLLGTIAFLLGRVSVMGEVTSIGLAFFAAVAQRVRQHALWTGFCAALGVASSGYYMDASLYAMAVLAYVYGRRQLTAVHRKVQAIPLLLFSVLLAGGMVTLLFSEATIYKGVVVIFNASICLLLSYVFPFGIPLLLKPRVQESSSEEIVCMLVILAGASAGLGDWGIGGFHFRELVNGVLIMVLASFGGAGLGAASGVAVGVISGLNSGNTAFTVAVWGVAGLLSGAFRSLGKGAILFGYLVGSLWILLYFGQVERFMEGAVQSAAAASLFALLPGRLLRGWQGKAKERQRLTVNSGLAVQEAMVKIQQIGETFREIAAAFAMESTARETNSEEDLARILRTVGEQVCEECEKRRICWEVDFYRTCQGVALLMEQAEKGKVRYEEIPGSLREQCIHLKEMAARVQLLAEQQVSQRYWKNKLWEQRHTVMEQLKAAGGILEELLLEIGKKQQAGREVEQLLRERAADVGCQIVGVQVKGSKAEQRWEVRMKPCAGQGECRNTVLPLAAGLIQEKLVLHSRCGDNRKKRDCHLTLQLGKRFSLETGLAGLPKTGQTVSGDTATVIRLNKGKAAVLLSDGMGSGSGAAGQSGLAIGLLKKLLTAGFSTEVAIKTVNSMLLLHGKETFATVDMAIIDTYSGTTDFLKIGAAPSFVKRVREVQMIQKPSLPMGILQQVEILPVQVQLTAGDFLVLASDGIADLVIKGREEERWLANYLRRSQYDKAQQLAEAIVAQAMTLSGNTAKDDMTVLVVKLAVCEKE